MIFNFIARGHFMRGVVRFKNCCSENQSFTNMWRHSLFPNSSGFMTFIRFYGGFLSQRRFYCCSTTQTRCIRFQNEHGVVAQRVPLQMQMERWIVAVF
ncbi:hypothetical protein CDAR_208841 [Caerostris darwini]|uniref:Uncharacterized protein n=1 Tax=Caerostris darwini TaxID=1538125 RepID=A0AAV4VQ60_9ARAC|nr:hypothetical protein CDAR_208841 [Caerostris darwini]